MEKHSKSKVNVLLYFGVGLILVSLLVLGKIFYPVIREELSYSIFSQQNKDKVLRVSFLNQNNDVNQSLLIPIDSKFGIVIPKINANAKVIDNVDPIDSRKYQWALTQGVAHASGSSYPGNGGNTFLFAHSSNNFYNANLYNSIFYLLNKLDGKDVFYISYKDELYEYEVVEKKIVNPEEVDYLSPTKREQGKETATLMTCWPPGTTMKRLIVVGMLKEKIDFSEWF